MPLPDPTYFPDLQDPGEWSGLGFELVAQDQRLVALPPNVGLTSELGPTDPYEYDHTPFDDHWYRIGDGIPRERPLLQLGGRHIYRTDAEALEHTSLLEQVVQVATDLYWQGWYVTSLNREFPQTVQFRTGERFRDTTYSVTLNTTERVTRQLLAEVVNLWTVVGSGPGYLDVRPQRNRFFAPASPVVLTTSAGTVYSFPTVSLQGAARLIPLPRAPAARTLTLTVQGPRSAPLEVWDLTTDRLAFRGPVRSLPLRALDAGHTYEVRPGAVDDWTAPAAQRVTLTQDSTLTLPYVHVPVTVTALPDGTLVVSGTPTRTLPNGTVVFDDPPFPLDEHGAPVIPLPNS